MLLEDVMQVLPLLTLQAFVANLFLFGDMNNAPRPWINSLQEHIIILKGFELCVLCMLRATIWDRRLNLCSLTMNQVTPSKFQM
jgi:hypothetical protein